MVHVLEIGVLPALLHNPHLGALYVKSLIMVIDNLLIYIIHIQGTIAGTSNYILFFFVLSVPAMMDEALEHLESRKVGCFHITLCQLSNFFDNRVSFFH